MTHPRSPGWSRRRMATRPCSDEARSSACCCLFVIGPPLHVVPHVNWNIRFRGVYDSRVSSEDGNRSSRKTELLETAYEYVLCHGLGVMSLRPIVAALASVSRL